MKHGAGLTVTLRVRVPSLEGASAPDGSDGTRLLALFADAAKELLIRLDGDEGDLASYQGVEFLEPARPGDFVEVTAVVTRVGLTTRHMAFEARRVVTPARDPRMAPTAADALKVPVPLCRAIATCVVPEERQRKPLIVLPALTAPAPDAAGLPEPHVIVTPAPHVIVTPVSPELMIAADLGDGAPAELAARAAECRDAGACAVVLPGIDLSGSSEEKRLEQTVAEIRQRTDVLVSAAVPSTGASAEVGMPSPVDVAELECQDLGALERVLERLRRASSPACVVRLVLGEVGSAPARPDVLRFMASQLPDATVWGLVERGAEGDLSPTLELGLSLGGHLRVPAARVAAARAAAERVGRVPVDPARARELFGLHGA